ncbi:Rhodanese-like domain-containing protein [Aspergillus pseudotamarii]|uniref:Rhodanese-like domain-containing protein n=1 Tax=Aspergillus pseudotamarii TaxID=132259 RepID=A0A5N6T9B9_ASPPS|nr:Rhodanese-like domain-containing protein [Aspergillus pseudotamarii]KAE8142867.1 Rhodanese-like domain-containing protein [Aspergillus pseudotamarii]
MSTDPFPSILVTPEEFHSVRRSTTRRIIPVAAGRGALRSSYEKQHIPGSVFFDMDVIADTTSPYPQMLPTANYFAHCMGKMGVQPDDILVVYDAVEIGMYSAPRVAWACRLFGHESVHVLNNFRLYTEQGYPVEEGGMSSLPQTVYPVHKPDANHVIAFEELRNIILHERKNYYIIDARIPGRFSGTQEEADPTLRSGHMPSAINIPLAAMLDAESKAFLPLSELKGLFEKAGLDGTTPVILTCNSGVTAAALDLSLQVTGYDMERRVYDGSWMEWTRRAGSDLVVRD